MIVDVRGSTLMCYVLGCTWMCFASWFWMFSGSLVRTAFKRNPFCPGLLSGCLLETQREDRWHAQVFSTCTCFHLHGNFPEFKQILSCKILGGSKSETHAELHNHGNTFCLTRARHNVAHTALPNAKEANSVWTKRCFGWTLMPSCRKELYSIAFAAKIEVFHLTESYHFKQKNHLQGHTRTYKDSFRMTHWILLIHTHWARQSLVVSDREVQRLVAFPHWPLNSGVFVSPVICTRRPTTCSLKEKMVSLSCCRKTYSMYINIHQKQHKFTRTKANVAEVPAQSRMYANTLFNLIVCLSVCLFTYLHLSV